MTAVVEPLPDRLADVELIINAGSANHRGTGRRAGGAPAGLPSFPGEHNGLP